MWLPQQTPSPSTIDRGVTGHCGHPFHMHRSSPEPQGSHLGLPSTSSWGCWLSVTCLTHLSICPFPPRNGKGGKSVSHSWEIQMGGWTSVLWPPHRLICPALRNHSVSEEDQPHFLSYLQGLQGTTFAHMCPGACRSAEQFQTRKRLKSSEREQTREPRDVVAAETRDTRFPAWTPANVAI